MAHVIHCDACDLGQTARRPNLYNLTPFGWFEFKGPACDFHACSEACKNSIPAVNVVDWKEVKEPTVKETVGQAACKWCARIKKLCPAHNRKVG